MQISMTWQTMVVCLVALVVTTAGQQIPGVNEEELVNLFGTPPTEAEDEDCVCVPFFQCKNGTFNEFGETVIDIRLGEKCEDTLQSCCSEQNREPAITPTTEGTYVEPTEESFVETSPEVPVVPWKPEAKPDREGCGIRNPRGVGFEITGATDGEANFGEFPWMVALMTRDAETGLIYKCGGSLIHDQIVLTAAHCLTKLDIDSLVVRAGEWDTQSIQELYPFQERGVIRTIVHPKFNAKDLRNDIALLVLETPFDPAPHIDVICLPQQGYNVDYNRCFASGWGKDNYGQKSQYQAILKSIELPIMPYAECLKAFRSTRLGHVFRLDSSFICAGGEKGKDLCKGDGGGPLVCPMSDESTRYIQAGIVAWGIGCGEEGIPGAYASVAMFRDWIDQMMAGEGFGPDTYTRPENLVN